MINRELLKVELPHGYITIIAKKAGVSQPSVSRYLSGKLNSEKIENAVLATIAEIKTKKSKLLKAAGYENK